MIDVGMDLGSTYTIISIYRKDTGRVETLNLGMTSASIPSVAILDKGHFLCGMPVKGSAASLNTRIFTDFKLLLAEKSHERLQSYGFDETYTPEKLTHAYIEEILRRALVYSHAHVIDRLVVTVPYFWCDGSDAAGRSEALRSICLDLNFIRHVQIISEPVAASVFFAKNFQALTGEAFEGHMLLADYGGRSLKLTLADVSGERSDETVTVEILEHTETGENSEDKAGADYIETLLRLVMCEAGLKEDAVGRDSRFLRALAELEAVLIKKTEMIEDVFEEYGIDVCDALENLNFANIAYGEAAVWVTYGQMLRAYKKTIEPILKDKIDEMIYLMKIHNVPYTQRKGNDFKLVIMGGFGSFYLVQKQLQYQLMYNSYDQRSRYLMSEKDDAVHAISKGAVFIASEKAIIPQNAPFGLGIWTYNEDNSREIYDAIRFNQQLVFDKVYYARDKKGNPYVLHVPSGSIERFAVTFDEKHRHYEAFVAKPLFAGRLEYIVQNPFKTAVIGFSVDSAGVISIHIHDYDIIENHMAPKARVIELAQFENLFKMTGDAGGGGKK